jgi:ATP-binding cassette subfamily B protein/subfamily B ATP-binding cassette protein MsbA
MLNLRRALSIALRYRWRFVLSVVCALGIAFFWAANISAVLPLVRVLFERQTIQEWVDGKIADTESAMGQLDAQIAIAKNPAAESPEAGANVTAPAAANLRHLERQRQYEENSLARYARAKPLVDRYLPHDAFQTLLVIVACVMVGSVCKNVLYIGHSILVAQLANLATFHLRNRFYRQTLRMDLDRFSNDGSSDLMSRFTYDMENVAAGVREVFGKATREPLKMIACLIGAAWVSWQLLVFSLLIAPVAAWAIGSLARVLKRANRKAMEKMSQIYTVLEETLQGIKVVKAFTMERHERKNFHAANKTYYRRAMRIARYDSLTKPLTESMGMVTVSLALMAGAHLVINQSTHLFGIRMCATPLGMPEVMTFFAFLAGVSDPSRKLSEVFNRIQRASAAFDRIYAKMDIEPTIVDPLRPVTMPRHQREITFDRVDFAYTPNQPILQGVDLTIRFGETIAIVGPNGCGKSTLANLIPRFFDASDGAVRVDGVDVRDVRIRELREQIGIVTQETLLFDDTVMNNIRYGSPGASDEQVIQASQRAYAHRFVEEKLPDGYQTIVGPRGGLLSGGQRQRIALARAILRDPAILILDEATSQVDLESEQLIHKVLEQFTRSRTTIVITHRMGTLSLADRIVVMEAGRITDIGSHAELLARCSLYSRLHDIQFKEIA